ncbi:MAG: hypothetical protein GY765_28255 [bacterium]|nr:hypothetical protein [bacterium]
MTKSDNPFITGTPARGSGFIGRESIIDKIGDFLNNKSQYNLLIFGQRRIGKTSLLRKLQDDRFLPFPIAPVYLNLQDKAGIPIHKLLYDIALRLVTDLEMDMEVKSEDFTEGRAEAFFTRHFFPLVAGAMPENKQLLLLFDEFDVLGDTEDVHGDAEVESFASRRFIPFITGLVEEIKEKNYPVKIIFAVGRNYKDLAPRRFGGILKFGSQEELGYFSLQGLRGLLMESSQWIPFSEEAVEEVYRLTAGHPYFSQCLASAAFEAAEKEKAAQVSAEMVSSRFHTAIKRSASGVFWVWDSLAPRDRVHLYIIALLKKESAAITLETIRKKAAELDLLPALDKTAQTLDHLLAFKFLRQDKECRYDFYVPFFMRWISDEMSEADIGKQLDSLEDDISFHLHNARYFYGRQKYRDAVSHFTEVLQKSPYHFEALLHAARCHSQLIDEDGANLDAALELYRRAYELNRGKTKKEYHRLLDEKLGLPTTNSPDSVEKAETVLEDVLAVEPGDGAAADRLVEIRRLKEQLVALDMETENLENRLEYMIKRRAVLDTRARKRTKRFYVIWGILWIFYTGAGVIGAVTYTPDKADWNMPVPWHLIFFTLLIQVIGFFIVAYTGKGFSAADKWQARLRKNKKKVYVYDDFDPEEAGSLEEKLEEARQRKKELLEK